MSKRAFRTDIIEGNKIQHMLYVLAKRGGRVENFEGYGSKFVVVNYFLLKEIQRSPP